MCLDEENGVYGETANFYFRFFTELYLPRGIPEKSWKLGNQLSVFIRNFLQAFSDTKGSSVFDMRNERNGKS